MNAFEQMASALESYSAATASTSQRISELGRAAERAAHSFDALTRMGFDADERIKINAVAMATGINSELIGEWIAEARFRAMIENVKRAYESGELFVFWRDFDWRKAALFTLIIAVAAILTGG